MFDADRILEALGELAPTLLTVVVGVGVLSLARWWLILRPAARGVRTLGRRLVMIGLTAVFVAALILALPIGETTRGQLFGLVGILLSAVVALSSTTFVGNAMAGLMLRAVRSFRAGDFLRVGDVFGRVSELGFLHTEVQTEQRDLTTVPNLHLVTHPVTVVRASGTILSATVSLGYDVARTRVETLLLGAIEAAGLTDPFVHVVDLGDFSVTYRASGFLAEVKHLPSARSALRASMMDALHGDGVEIVSPNFMNQRVFPVEQAFVPPQATPIELVTPPQEQPEALMFDKADEAASREQLKARATELAARMAEMKGQLDTTESDEVRARLEGQIQRLDRQLAEAQAALERSGKEPEPKA